VGEPVKENLNQIAMQAKMKQNVRSLIRSLQHNVPALDALQNASSGVSGPRSLTSMIRDFMDLRDISHRKLHSSLEDDQGKKALLKEMQIRKDDAVAYQETLTQKLNKAIRDKDAELGELDKVVRKLREEVAEIEKQTHDESSRLSKEVTEEHEVMRQEHEAKVKYYSEEISKLEKSITESNEKNRETERMLRKAKNKLQHEVDHLIQQYDTEMSTRRKLMEVVDIQHRKEGERLQELRVHFRKIDDEQGRIDAENAIIQQELGKCNHWVFTTLTSNN
jgi:hypothetical protein